MEKYQYCCQKCGKIKDWDAEIVWITSSYGVCQDCYDSMSEDEIERIRVEYE
jgi:hypothetical protein